MPANSIAAGVSTAAEAFPRTRHDLNESPLIVFYETTQACDLFCAHCRASAQVSRNPRELSTELGKRLIDQMREFPKPPMLVLTGGDPLKRPDIYDLIGHARQIGLEVSLTPSATPLVTFEALQKLRESGIARLAISLDGADAATHDGFRRVAGSYERTLQILSEARQLGIASQVNTTLGLHNYDQIEAIAELVGDYSIVLWSVFFLVPVGRALDRPRLSAEQCELAFERLFRESQRRPYAVKTTEAPHYRRFAIQRSRSAGQGVAAAQARQSPRGFSRLGINDGKGVMFVDHLGRIFPSGFLPIYCGRFPTHHLVEVYQDSPLFRELRDADRLEGKCGRCEFRNLCGGSRARAYALTANAFAEEPDCAYLPMAPAV